MQISLPLTVFTLWWAFLGRFVNLIKNIYVHTYLSHFATRCNVTLSQRPNVGLASKNKVMKQEESKLSKAHNETEIEITAKTKLYDLVKEQYHDDLRKLGEDIRPYVIDFSWEYSSKIIVDYTVHLESKSRKTNTVVILHIANFLDRIGRRKGLNCKMKEIIEYLSSAEHSNFDLKKGPIKTLIYSCFGYHKSKNKDTEKV